MTREELIEYQRKEKEFGATPMGAAFFKFKNALAAAWREDAAIEYQESRSEKRAKELWLRADAAESEFRELIVTAQSALTSGKV